MSAIAAALRMFSVPDKVHTDVEEGVLNLCMQEPHRQGDVDTIIRCRRDPCHNDVHDTGVLFTDHAQVSTLSAAAYRTFP